MRVYVCVTTPLRSIDFLNATITENRMLHRVSVTHVFHKLKHNNVLYSPRPYPYFTNCVVAFTKKKKKTTNSVWFAFNCEFRRMLACIQSVVLYLSFQQPTNEPIAHTSVLHCFDTNCSAPLTDTLFYSDSHDRVRVCYFIIY